MIKQLLKSYRKNDRESSAGYTVFELLAVISIVSALLAVMLLNSPQTKLQFSLSRVANKFQQDVRRAEDLAVSSKEFKDSAGAYHSVTSYGIYIDTVTPPTRRYIVYGDKDSSKSYNAATDYIVETIDFSTTEPGIVINNAINVDINFTSPGPLTTGASDVVFKLASDATKTKTVSVYSTGLVEVK